MPRQTTKKSMSLRNKSKARKTVKKEVKKNAKKEPSSQRTKREQRANATQRENSKSRTKTNKNQKNSNTAQVRKHIAKMEENKETKMQPASHIKVSKTKQSSSPSSSLSSSKSTKRPAPKEAKKAVTSSSGAKVKVAKSKRKEVQKLVEVKSKGKQQENASTINAERSVKVKSSVSDIKNNVVTTTQIPKEQMSEKELVEQEKEKQQQQQSASKHDANNEQKNVDHVVEKTTINVMQLLPTIVPSHLTSTEADLIARHGKLEEMNVVLQTAEKDGNNKTCDSSEIIKMRLNALVNERRVKEEARQRRRSLLSQVQPRDEQVVSRLVASGFDKSSAMFAAIVSRLIKYINNNTNN